MGWDDDEFGGLFGLLIYLRYLPQCTLWLCAVGCLLLQIYSNSGSFALENIASSHRYPSIEYALDQKLNSTGSSHT